MTGRPDIPSRASVCWPHAGNGDVDRALGSRSRRLWSGGWDCRRPGVGKSRLLAEFIRACQPTSVRPLETWSTAYTQTMPYWPFIDLLRGYFSIDERDDGPMIREKAVQQLVYLDLLRSLILSLLLSCWRGPSMIRPAGHRSPATPPAHPRRHSARADTRE
jgi:hypothetical protein